MGIYQNDEDFARYPATLNSTVGVGDLIYEDISGPDGVPDGIINAEYDRVPLGNSLPRFQYGGQFSCAWKGIDFSLAFQGIGKQQHRLVIHAVVITGGFFGVFTVLVAVDVSSGFTQSATFEGSVQGVVVHARKYASSSAHLKRATADFSLTVL